METKGERTPGDRKSEMQSKPQHERKHPEEYAADLGPNRMAGQNIGQADGAPGTRHRTAEDVKDVHRSLGSAFGDDELRAIPIIEEGERLMQGATYLDITDPARREFTATGEMEARPGSRIVPKAETPYSLWNRLRGVDEPERIAERGPRAESDRERRSPRPSS